ncbi:cytochrome P450 [Leptodontidium sp. 2 PMI_412]|nr:cytochrome P450 [Leptodontidium sp. 2 PMI_412]
MSSAFSSPLLLSVAGVLVVVSFIRFLLHRPERLDIPIIEIPGSRDQREALVQGTARYPDSPFIIQSRRPLVILPISVIDEVRNLPENKVSFMQDVRISMAYKQTDIGGEGPEVHQAVKIDLTRHIASTLNDLQEEIQYGFDKEFGPCEDWTPISLYGKMTRIVALLSGRVFVGRPLSREEEWIQATVMFTFYSIQAKNAINAYPPYLRSIVAPFVLELRNLKKFRKRGAEMLMPILEQQLGKERNEKIHRDDNDDEQGTMISWILKHTPENKRSDALVLGNNQMGLSMAAIHTTSMATTAAIYDLATYPEYIQPLRDEIQQIIDEDGQDIDGDGIMRLKKSSIPKLWKLDSFLKESQRFTPPQLPTGNRVTTCDITLSTGHILPKGTRFGFAAWAIHQSSTTPSFNPAQNPSSKPVSEFDGLRYYNLRKIPGNENKHQFVTTSPDSLNFGHGNHACPGRFFASNEIKVVLIELLKSWEFRFKGDLEAKGGVERRPKNVFRDVICVPNTEAEVEFRRRKQ